MPDLNTPEAIVDALDALYREAVEALAAALTRYLREGTLPAAEERASRAFCYPELRITYAPDAPPPPLSRSFGKFSEPGVYTSTFTQPAFFREYLIEQLVPLLRDYEVT
ncbi:MAG: AMP nucleosidase, partial [Planctomycetota bacterium]